MDARKIIHVDMDAFYASVEQRDRPELRGRPVIVGGDPSKRGVVAACSYEAREFGVRSAMPAARAARLCPDAVFLRPRFEAYKSVSGQIHTVFARYTDLIEPLSLDEAYLDVTGCPMFEGYATRIARDIKAAIREETGLVASAGVSYNKFLAKTASDMDKPDGLYVILPEQGEAFVATLPVGRFHGIGKATEARMKALGIETGADLKARSLEDLQSHFGKAARYFHDIARARDHRPVNPHRERKSLGAERTFETDLHDEQAMYEVLERLLDELWQSLARRSLRARRLTLKVRYPDFRTVTRGRTFPSPMDEPSRVMLEIRALLARTDAARLGVRLLGLSFSAFDAAGRGDDATQMSLFAG
ncbi:MAG: DNA polymerase IV [Gammaproteobacteria bacterium]